MYLCSKPAGTGSAAASAQSDEIKLVLRHGDQPGNCACTMQMCAALKLGLRQVMPLGLSIFRQTACQNDSMSYFDVDISHGRPAA